MADRPDPHSPEYASLPKISEGVLKRFLIDPPDFETLYQKLKASDPRVAGWLLAATERVAPADAKDKERYGVIALRLYGMLLDQIDINQLEESLSLTFSSPPTETEDSSDTTVPPTT